MNRNLRLALAALLVAGLAMLTVRAAETATVKKNRVNVRGQASQKSEVVTQLKQGETVVVLEEIDATKPKKGEPAKWARIQLPPNTPVWVFAPYIELTNKTVNIKRLNIRSGPGEKYSVLGRIDRGTPVKEIRTVDNWMEIEPPAAAYAFVAADLLEKTGPAPAATETAVAAANPTPAKPTTVETVTTEPAPAKPVDTAPTATPVATDTNAPPVSVATQPAPAPVQSEPARRVVSREGLVIVSRSIQAPTEYGLESFETKRTINYLHTEELGLKLKNFGGKKVIVTGEELIDPRWTNTPIIEVESIRLLP
jgi:SH3-like domain-containing protein